MLKTKSLRRAIEGVLEQIKQTTGQIEQPEWRRADCRFKERFQAKIELISADECSGEPEELLCTWIGNISAGGLNFLSPQNVPSGQRVLITLQTNKGTLQIPAMVVHSTGSDVRYKVGVKFELGED